MKKIIALFLLLVFVLCGCNQQSETNNSSVTNKNSSSSNNQQSETNNSSVTTEPKQEVALEGSIEICSYVVHQSLPKYEIKVEYGKKKKASYISLYRENENTEIQRFDLKENERFTKKAIYVVDITFDGYADVLVPRERPASAIYFMAFVWDTKTNKLVYAPGFDELPNIVLDTENKLYYCRHSASQITTYIIGFFDKNSNDFKESASLCYYPNDGHFFLREEKLENGVMKTVAEHKIPFDENSQSYYDLPILDDYAKNPYWEINSSKWDSNIIPSSDLSY